MDPRKASVRLLWMLCAVLLLSACASVQPETPNQRIYVGIEQANALLGTASQLHASGVLTDSEYMDVLDEVDQANQALTKARALLDAGDRASAMDRVELANEMLLSVRNRLAEERQDE